MARLRRLGGRWRLQPAPALAGAHAYDDADALRGDASAAGALHDVLKSTDYWFDLEVGQLESRAAELAAASAAAGLPRVDVAYDEVPEEQELAAGCRSVYRGWTERVQRRMRDALQHSVEQAGDGLRRYEGELGALDSTLRALPATRARLEDAHAAAQSGQAEITYKPFLPFWVYLLIIGAIIVVDWIANVPVFTELLPKDPGAEAGWRILAARGEEYGLWSGVYRTFARAAYNIDASLLAFGVIAALVALAHFVGAALRHMTAHSQRAVPSAQHTIREQRRQAVVPLLFAAFGIVFLLFVLWEARARLDDVTARAVAEADARIVAAENGLETARGAGDLSAIERFEDELGRAQTERMQRVERYEYATTISGMNLPILVLNLVLALTALVAAYLATRGSARGTITSAEVHALRARLERLIDDGARRRDALLAADRDIGRAVARADYLQRSDPLAGAASRRERLEAVIPRFRSENARLRGIDAGNIVAFRRAARLQLADSAAGDDAHAASAASGDAAHGTSTARPDDRRFAAAALVELRAAHEALRARAADVLAGMDALHAGQGREVRA